MASLRRMICVSIGTTLAAGVAGCGAAAPSNTTNTADTSAAVALTATTPSATGTAGAITWALNRAPGSLDPIASLDYPENAIVDSLCESLVRQRPDLSIEPGLAESATYTSPNTLTLKLRSGVTFSDGKPMTAADVVYSLQRAADPKLASFYAPAFGRVKSIAATDARTVTITLTKPDYWLRGQLSGMAGVVIEKAYAESKGKKYGTPQGGVRCTGPFTLKSWQAGGDVVIARRADYWDAARSARVSQITFKGVESDPNMAAGLTNGDIDGMYNPTLASYAQLKADPSLTVASGPSLTTDALVISSLKGVFGDARVRRAMSQAIDRQAYIASVYHGQAAIPRTSSNPGTWAYARSVFADTSGKRPELTQNLDEARSLAAAAGVKGKTIVIATLTVAPSVNTGANVAAQAARAIGLRVKLKALTPDTYNNLFLDPKARAGFDMFPTLNNPNYADPAPYLAMYTTPNGGEDFSGWEDPAVSRLLESARSSADDAQRARFTAEADAKITDALPWIPLAQPYSVLYLRKALTGAPASFMFFGGPWASTIGSAK